MANFNKVLLIGRLTRDPELRYTASQVPVTELGLAVNRTYSAGEGGETKEETLFVDVTVWNRQAETCCQYLTKGRGVHIEGFLRLDSWDDKTTGEKRSKLKVVAERVQFLDGGRRDDGGAPRGEDSMPSGRPAEPRRNNFADRAPTPARAAASRPAAPASDGEEDIPF